MYLSKEKKAEIFETKGYERKTTDTGSAESQVALFTHRITHLTEHLKSNKKDNATRLGLLKLVGKRRKLLKYLEATEINRSRAIIKELGLRK
jgi:small subunit ribosomal protein S15